MWPFDGCTIAPSFTPYGDTLACLIPQYTDDFEAMFFYIEMDYLHVKVIKLIVHFF
jgi:hypothetical protein